MMRVRVLVVLGFIVASAGAANKPLVRQTPNSRGAIAVEIDGSLTNVEGDSSMTSTVIEDAPPSLVSLGASAKLRNTINTLEQDVIKLTMAKVTPEVVHMATEIKAMIDSLRPSVKNAHEGTKNLINNLYGAFGGCDRTREADASIAASVQSNYTMSSAAHKACRVLEEIDWQSHETCKAEFAPLNETKGLKCRLFKIAKKDTDNVDAHEQEVQKQQSESTGAYINDVSQHFNDLRESYETTKAACEEATRIADAKEAECNTKKAKLIAKRTGCNADQQKMEVAACRFAMKRAQTCNAFNRCFVAATEPYNAAITAGSAAVNDRKGEWEALARIDCLLQTISNNQAGSVHPAAIRACHESVVDTSEFDLAISDPPGKAICTFESVFPCNAAYSAREIDPLPTNAKGLPCVPCTSMPATDTEGSAGGEEGGHSGGTTSGGATEGGTTSGRAPDGTSDTSGGETFGASGGTSGSRDETSVTSGAGGTSSRQNDEPASTGDDDELDDDAIATTVGPTKASASCCKVCRKGRACGDTCIAADRECSKPRGCACQATTQ